MMIIQDFNFDKIVAAIKAGLESTLDQKRKARHAERQTLLNFYDGATKQYVEQMFKKKILKQIPIYTGKLTKQFIDKRSLVYKRAPNTLLGDDNSAYHKYIKNGGLNELRRQFERMRNLVGTIGILSSWDNLNSRLKWRTLVDFEPYFMPGLMQPVGVSYQVQNYGNARSSKQMFIFWSRDFEYKGQKYEGKHFYYDSDGKVKAADPDNPGNFDNPILNRDGNSILPVSFVHSAPQIDSFYTDGAVDIANCHWALIVGLAEVNIAIRFDALGLKYATGFREKQSIPFGTENILGLPGERSTMGKLPGADLGNIMEALRGQVELTAQDNFLKVKFGDKGVAPSGVSLQIENIDNLEQREADVETWRVWEQDRAIIDDAVIRARTGEEAFNPEKYRVDFAEVTFPQTPAEIQAQTEFDLKFGFTTWEEEMKKRNPDITETELEKRRENYINSRARIEEGVEQARDQVSNNPIQQFLNGE